jgi:acyl CoA:acetate/3-ketoacid CoA transferase alpha subunit
MQITFVQKLIKQGVLTPTDAEGILEELKGDRQRIKTTRKSRARNAARATIAAESGGGAGRRLSQGTLDMRSMSQGTMDMACEFGGGEMGLELGAAGSGLAQPLVEVAVNKDEQELVAVGEDAIGDEDTVCGVTSKRWFPDFK